MIDTVLVPTDGSDHALRAAKHGKHLAELFDATVHVINVCHVQREAGLFDAGGVSEDYVERLEKRGEESVDSVVGVLGEGVDVETSILRGRPSDRILEYVDELDADLLAMGTQGRTGLDRFVTGSVTEAVLRRSQQPVLTVRSEERSRLDGQYDDVLIPTDGSEGAKAALDFGVEIARRSDARVHAVHVVATAELAGSPESTIPNSVLEDIEQVGEEAAEEFAETARSAGLEAVSTVLKGSPQRELLSYAEEEDVDLITMGTAGRSGIERYILGSTTEYVIRRSEVPVVAVPRTDRD